MERIPTAQEWNELSLEGARERDLAEERAHWNEMAPGYAHKRRRGGYLAQMLDLLALQPGESAFDMGCGPGVLSVPLAAAGHDVVAVDFSDGMLAELRSAVADAGVADRVQAFQRAWQDDWADLPSADVVFSSRSLTSPDFADAVAKMESKARKRVVISSAAGETPWCDLVLQRALGRSVDPMELSRGFVILANYLLMSGRMPRIDYIVDRRRSQSEDADELRSFLRRTGDPLDEREEEAFEAFFAAHVIPREDGGVQLDYEQTIRWAVLTWDVQH